MEYGLIRVFQASGIGKEKDLKAFTKLTKELKKATKEMGILSGGITFERGRNSDDIAESALARV